VILFRKVGSSGWTRTSNPPVNSVMQVFGLAGSRAGSSGEILLIPGVRERIGQRLARRLDCVSRATVLLKVCRRVDAILSLPVTRHRTSKPRLHLSISKSSQVEFSVTTFRSSDINDRKRKKSCERIEVSISVEQ
jgi:hypothetical protein